MGLLDTLFAGGMQGNPEPDPQEAMLADLFRKLQASQQVQTQGVVNPGSTPAPDAGRVGMFSPSSAAAQSAFLSPAPPQVSPVQAPQPGVPDQSNSAANLSQSGSYGMPDVFASMPQDAPPPMSQQAPQMMGATQAPQSGGAPTSQAMQRPGQAPQREANFFDHLGRLAEGYSSGGLIGGIARMGNTGRDMADTNQTVAALGQQLGDPQMARMIMQDPELRKSVVPLLFKQKLGLGDVPANVQEWKYYNRLSDEEKQAYLTMKRAQKFYDTGLQHVQPNAANPGGAPAATIAKDPAGAAFASQDGKNAAEQIEARDKAIQASRDKLPRLLQIEALAQNPAVYQGKGGEWVLEAKKLGAAFGIDLGTAAPAELMASLTKQLALQLRSTAGGEGMPGALSDQDRNFLEAMTPGITKTPQGNAMIVRAAIEMEHYKAAMNAEANRYVRSRKSSFGLSEHLDDWAKANPAVSEQTRKMLSGSGAQAPTAPSGGGWSIKRVQ